MSATKKKKTPEWKHSGSVWDGCQNEGRPFRKDSTTLIYMNMNPDEVFLFVLISKNMTYFLKIIKLRFTDQRRWMFLRVASEVAAAFLTPASNVQYRSVNETFSQRLFVRHTLGSKHLHSWWVREGEGVTWTTEALRGHFWRSELILLEEKSTQRRQFVLFKETRWASHDTFLKSSVEAWTCCFLRIIYSLANKASWTIWDKMCRFWRNPVQLKV